MLNGVSRTKGAQGAPLLLAVASMGIVTSRCGRRVNRYGSCISILAQFIYLLQAWQEADVTPPSPSAGTSPTMQLVRFAVICVLVNVVTHALHSGSLSNFYLSIKDSIVRLT
jgi:hypothetical protein